MKYILSISILLLLQGCLDSEKHGQDTQAPTTSSQVAYVPFVENKDNPNTMSLYKTEGVADKTKKLYEITSETTGNLFSNFIILGEYIYYDYREKNIGDGEVLVKQVRTHIPTDKTDAPLDIGRVSFSQGNRSNRVKINNTFYIKRREGFAQNYYLEQYHQDTNTLRIEYPSSDDNDVLTDTSMVLLDKFIYMSTGNTLVKFDPNKHTFSNITLSEDLYIKHFIGINQNVYFLAYNRTLDKHQLWQYNTQTKIDTFLYTFQHTSVFDSTMHKNDTNIFINFKQSFNDFHAFSYNTPSKKMTTLPKPNSLSHRIRNHGDLIYYSARDENNDFPLWQSDGSLLGTKKVLDAASNVIKARNLTIIANKIYFANTTNTHGEELWVIDNNGTRMLIDINQGVGSSFPRYMTKLNDGIVFQATENGVDNHLYFYTKDTLKLLK